MRTLFIVNPAAGSHRTPIRWTALESRLRETGFTSAAVFTQGPGEAAQLARQASGDYQMVVAVGGDGTTSEVADGLLSAGSNATVLGVVPFGTGNDFAAALGIRSEGAALKSLVSGKTRTVDAIAVGCQLGNKTVLRHALLFAGVGIICETLRRTTGRVKRIFGQRLSYPVGLGWAMLTYHSPRMRIRCDQQTYDERFLFVGASNTEIAGGGMRIAPGARVDDGWLDVNLVQSLPRWRAVQQLRRVCRGLHIHHPQVKYFPARSLHVETEAPIEVAADGDLIGHTPAQFEVRPKILQVRVP